MGGLFLDADELATLTGVKMGRGGLSRSQRQVAALRTMGILFYVNAIGRPIVARSLFEQQLHPVVQAPASRWRPAVLQSDAGVFDTKPRILK